MCYINVTFIVDGGKASGGAAVVRAHHLHPTATPACPPWRTASRLHGYGFPPRAERR
jgi:hypothetical protein